MTLVSRYALRTLWRQGRPRSMLLARPQIRGIMMVGPQILGDENEEDSGSSKKNDPKDDRREKFSQAAFKALETAAVTFATLTVLGVSGIMYHIYYQKRVLKKIRMAFNEGDPSLDMAFHSNDPESADWIVRDEQAIIDKAVSGRGLGRYYLIIGEKGTGKTSMLLEALRRVEGRNCAMFEAHSDPEIVRIRLGKALNYQYHEDYIGSLFSIRGPRDTTALLDIERAFDKLEEVALDVVKEKGRPLVLIVNSTHLLREDDDGENLVELLQQRAEQFAASGILTMIFNSDDYWVYERFKKLSTRLDVVTIKDLGRAKAIEALQHWRRKYFGDSVPVSVCNRIYDMVGGRPQFLNRVAQHSDMLAHAQQLVETEKTWFLNQCGLLGEDMDDDVMESGKFSGSAMLLAKELVEMEKKHIDSKGKPLPDQDHILPSLPLWRARQVMTRADYIQRYDNLNIFTIDSKSHVRADSAPMMEAFRQICAEPGFDNLLEETLDRVSAIESLGRTRELVLKDLVGGGKYRIELEKGNSWKGVGNRISMEVVPPPEEEDDD
ncbi:hypothetical protein BZA70DRAFT_272107 [Myxozyma melibiosi]|uniref:Orc1-like AAA ATPase domain-containing protein n=1 Tax=Myxozyma melibiosi TaxID=54550 RepID=A0ABR1FD54_9ASCO